MNQQEFTQLYEKDLQVKRVAEKLHEPGVQRVHLKELAGSLSAIIAASVFKNSTVPHLFVLNDKEEAAYFLNDIQSILGERDVLFFPGSYRRPYQIEETENANVLLRAEVLNRLSSRRKAAAVVTYPEGLFEKVITRKELSKNTLRVKESDMLSPDFLNETLNEYHFERVDFVTDPGQFSIRGGIVDVFSFSNDMPYRIEFFGDEVDSIRSFDIETQVSEERVKAITIVPNVSDKTMVEQRESFLHYLSKETVIWTKNAELAGDRLEKNFEKAQEAFEELSGGVRHRTPEELFLNRKAWKKELNDFDLVEFGQGFMHRADEAFAFGSVPQPAFNKNFELLAESLHKHDEQGYENLILCASAKQVERFHDIFEDIDAEVKFTPVLYTLHEGFIDHERKIVCYTDHQIFDRYHKFRLKTGFEKKQAITLKELTSLQVGDFVTHIDHGIGTFGGLKKIDVNGKQQEAIKLIYKDNDILYISIHSLHKISKYNGKEGTAPKIHKLGSGTWAKTKAKTKTKVKKIAYDLIKLYAKRKEQKGFACGPDSYLQLELEASFIYEDTPDQEKATEMIKEDMQKEMPMDRLVCGDVGFGKTELAVRAAFKAVDNGKQVAILVPTTVLAFQHYKTFVERLKDFPVTVEYINRFRSTKQQRETLKRLEEGKVDILIGTHRIVGKDVKWKDLGLLVIDEEQKFGVGVKDKLKTIRVNVDTLTLSATPIPRTMQFSLMGARDLSVLSTPPPNRYPVQTEVRGFNEELIRDAVAYEVSRGGQVFFVHNRIENISEVAGMIQRLLPDVKIGVAHGQMEGAKLEKIMLAFMEGEFDVLISTTIIESGLDISNANTIIINNANFFGLSDLHQMRGRVGRSNKKAFAYMIAPPYSAMTEEARKRLKALEQFSDLGSGFNIAMRDLEIRGAGDLLGAEQSGFIGDIGFEMYQKILGEALNELKQEEFKDLYKQEEDKMKHFLAEETLLDTDLEILIPDDYVNNIAERLALYRQLNNLQTEEELRKFEQGMIDRFGEIPPAVHDLLISVRLRWIGRKLGFEKLTLKANKMIGFFISDQSSPFYQSATFTQILNYLKNNFRTVTMKERNNRLTLSFQNVPSVDRAIELLRDILTD